MVSCALVVALLSATACGDGATKVSAALVSGVRTTPDGRGLVVSYTGGACDTSARLIATETNATVGLSVEIHTADGSCAAVGITRTVTVVLQSPLSTRGVSYDDSRVTPFDGRRLQTPAALPADFAPTAEFSELARTPGSAPIVTDRWTLNWSSDRAANDRSAPCRPARGRLSVTFAALDAGNIAAGAVVDHLELNGRPATVYEQRDTPQSTISATTLLWDADGGQVALSAATACHGDAILSTDQLLTLAASLQPMS